MEALAYEASRAVCALLNCISVKSSVPLPTIKILGSCSLFDLRIPSIQQKL